ncbi:hypothetical protein ABTX71_30015 [Streptomyces parvulus]|uniref:ATP-grasp domain-containing protein n=1 Tax=Streptomyces parvulus TaxID=146923 RepID=UPI003330D7C2
MLQKMTLDECMLDDLAGEPVHLTPEGPVRGWLRRLAPAGWDRDVVLGSKSAARMAARMTALAAVLRQPGIQWLCGVDALFAAENKIVQYQAARSLGLRTPTTVISGDPAALAAELGEPFVIKPLGPGNFTGANGREEVIYTQTVTAAQLAGVNLLDAPFLAQELLTAKAHLRIVTVTDRAWTAELGADGLPLDWRQASRAHHSFAASDRWPAVEHDAIRLAQHLATGISCQDWIVDDFGAAFIDLNPGGQWLFLPGVLTSQVADHLASWLRSA